MNHNSKPLEYVDEDEANKSKNYKEAIDYIRDNVQDGDKKKKYILDFGQTLAKYHPRPILEIIKGFIEEDMNSKPGIGSKKGTIVWANVFVASKSKPNPEAKECLDELIGFFIKNFDRLEEKEKILNLTFSNMLSKYSELKKPFTHSTRRDSEIEEVAEVSDKMMKMLNDLKFTDNMDKNHILLLLKHCKFDQGVEKMCELMLLNPFLLSYYIDRQNIDEALNFCKTKAEGNADLWITF